MGWTIGGGRLGGGREKNASPFIRAGRISTDRRGLGNESLPCASGLCWGCQGRVVMDEVTSAGAMCLGSNDFSWPVVNGGVLSRPGPDVVVGFLRSNASSFKALSERRLIYFPGAPHYRRTMTREARPHLLLYSRNGQRQRRTVIFLLLLLLRFFLPICEAVPFHYGGCIV